jgi:alkylation response protein AidB-like acyl-CoA dehydrogenase
MNLSFTEEQSLLRDSLAAYLADHYTFEQRRAALKSEAGWRPQVWKAFAEDLGILGAALPEDLGGLGGGATETMVIMEELGKALVVEPFLGSVVIGGGFLTRSGQPAAKELIAQIIAGEAILAFAAAEPQCRYNWADL